MNQRVRESFSDRHLTGFGLSPFGETFRILSSSNLIIDGGFLSPADAGCGIGRDSSPGSRLGLPSDARYAGSFQGLKPRDAAIFSARLKCRALRLVGSASL